MKTLNTRRRGVFAAALVAALLATGGGALVAPAPSASAAEQRRSCGSWNKVEKASKLAWRPCFEQTIYSNNTSGTWQYSPTRAYIEVANRYDSYATIDVGLSTFVTDSLGTRRHADRNGTFGIKAGSARVVARTDTMYWIPGEDGRLSGRFTIKDGRTGTFLNTNASSWRIDIVNGRATT